MCASPSSLAQHLFLQHVFSSARQPTTAGPNPALRTSSWSWHGAGAAAPPRLFQAPPSQWAFNRTRFFPIQSAAIHNSAAVCRATDNEAGKVGIRREGCIIWSANEKTLSRPDLPLCFWAGIRDKPTHIPNCRHATAGLITWRPGTLHCSEWLSMAEARRTQRTVSEKCWGHLYNTMCHLWSTHEG